MESKECTGPSDRWVRLERGTATEWPADPQGFVVAVLVDSTPDEWLRRWRATVDGGPGRQVLLDVGAVCRSAAAEGRPTMMPSLSTPSVRCAALPEPVDVDLIREFVFEHLGASERGGRACYVDSLDELMARTSPTDVRRFVAGLRADLVELDAVGYVRADPEESFELDEDDFGGSFGGSHRDEELKERVAALRRDSPTNFGYARRYWREVQRGVETTPRKYPQARQIHAELSDPSVSPRGLGAALKAVSTLGVLETWDDTVGPNRYDLTTYDPERMAAVGELLDDVRD
jgi:hypothetical protein